MNGAGKGEGIAGCRLGGGDVVPCISKLGGSVIGRNGFITTHCRPK